MAHEEEEGGLSTPQKVVAGAALGVAVPAAVGVARKLLGGGPEGGDDASSEPTARERESSTGTSTRPKTSPRRSSSKPEPGTKSRAKPNARRSVNRTREQLYKQATRLKIEGRSTMNKAQLERAIERAKAR